MLLSILIAVGAAFYRVEWFFPAMLFVIGGRYLTFSTLYGMRLYWVFSAALVISGFLLLYTNAPAFSGAFTGAFIEYLFAVALFFAHKSGLRGKPGEKDAVDDAF